MSGSRQSGRINVRVLLILVGAVTALGIAFAVGHYVRKRSIASDALAAGRSAIASQDWNTAARELRRYLGKYPNDLEVLEPYSDALLSARPLQAEAVKNALEVNRRILRVIEKQRLEQQDAGAHDDQYTRAQERLAKIYQAIGDHDELSYIAQKRLERHEGDPAATLWLAKAQMLQAKSTDAWTTLSTFVKDRPDSAPKCAEYVEACSLLSLLTTQGQGAGSAPAPSNTASDLGQSEPIRTALRWLEHAVAYDPSSAHALVARASFIRDSVSGGTEADAEARLKAVRADLERAESLGGNDPFVRLALCSEWRELGEFDRAAAQLKVAESAERGAVGRLLLDPDEWPVRIFAEAAELSLRRGTNDQGAKLAEEMLTKIPAETQPRQRQAILPEVIRLYVAVGDTAKARTALDEYVAAATTGRGDTTTNERLAFVRGLVAWSEGKPYEVIEIVEAAAQKNPQSVRLWQLLADAYGRTGQQSRATDAMAHWLERPTSGNKETSSAALSAAQSIEQMKPLIQVEIDRAFDKRDSEKKQALAQRLDEAIRQSPERADIRVLRASLAARDQKIDVAEGILKAAIKECPDATEAELYLSRVYRGTGRADDALNLLKAVCEKVPQNKDAWLALSETQRAAQDPKAALQTLQTAVEKVTEPSSKSELSRALALAQAVGGDRRGAVERLRQIAAADPQDISSRVGILQLLDMPEESIIAQKLVDEIKAAERESGLQWRYYQARVWLAQDDWQGRRKEIESLLTHCINADGAEPAFALALGDLYERLGHVDQAEQTYRRALKPEARDSVSTELENRLLTLLQKNERFTDVLAVLDQLGRPSRWQGFQILAAEKTGDRDQAIATLQARVAADESDLNARVLLARMVFAKSNNRKAAMELLDQAEKIAPGSPLVLDTRVEILRSDNAVALARQVVDAAVTKNEAFENYLVRARFLSKIGDAEAAESDYIKLTDFPGEGQGHMLLGQFYIDHKRADDAIRVWHEGVEAYPKNSELPRLLMKGYAVRRGDGDRERALAIAEQIESRSPDDFDVLATRSVLALSDGTEAGRARAEELLKRAVELKASSSETAAAAYVQLVQFALDRGEMEAARQRIKEALNKLPPSPTLWLAQAEVERRSGDVRAACTWAGLVIKDDPDNAEARGFLVQTALRTGDEQAIIGAIPLVERAIEKEDDKRAWRLTMAELNRLRRDFDGAGRWIDKAAADQPDAPEILAARIRWFGDKKEFDRVQSAIVEYRQRGGADLDVFATAAGALANSGVATYRQTALELLEQCSKLAPDRIGLQLDLALLVYQMGNAERAETLYRKVVAAHPKNARALNDLAWILCDSRKQCTEALEFADRAVAIEPENANIRDTRGHVLSKLSDRQRDARADYQKCVDLAAANSPARARALLKLARICSQLKDGAAVREAVKEAGAIDQRHNVFSADERAELKSLLPTESASR